jgi:ankyrin repeat protein
MKRSGLFPARRFVAAVAFAATLVPAQAAEVLGANDQPVHDAARLGSGAEVQAILKATPPARDARTLNGTTPLHLAATNPDISALKVLIASGADVNARNNEGVTPLHMAAYTLRAEHAQILLEAGADPGIKTHNGRDALSMARKNMANEVAGVISLWILKGCKPRVPC